MLRIVALKLYHKSYQDLVTLASAVIAGFAAEVATYPTPSPTIISVTTDLATLNSAITAWGTKGNRGSHADLLNLRAARDVMRRDLTQLAAYAENTTPGDRVALAGIGWDLKRPKHTIGMLEAVQNLHQFVARRVDVGTVKLKWKKPLNAVDVKVNGYIVLHSATNVFADAKPIGNSTKTSFTDLNPVKGINYYWVIPFSDSGDGVTSDVCTATPVFLP